MAFFMSFLNAMTLERGEIQVAKDRFSNFTMNLACSDSFFTVGPIKEGYRIMAFSLTFLVDCFVVLCLREQAALSADAWNHCLRSRVHVCVFSVPEIDPVCCLVSGDHVVGDLWRESAQHS